MSSARDGRPSLAPPLALEQPSSSATRTHPTASPSSSAAALLELAAPGPTPKAGSDPEVAWRLARLEGCMERMLAVQEQQRVDADTMLSQVCRNTQGLGDAKFKKAVLLQLQEELRPLTSALHTTIITHKAEREFISQQLQEVQGAVERCAAHAREAAHAAAEVASRTRWFEEVRVSLQDAVAHVRTSPGRNCEVLSPELEHVNALRERMEQSLQASCESFEAHQHRLDTFAEQCQAVARLEETLQRLTPFLERSGPGAPLFPAPHAPLPLTASDGPRQPSATDPLQGFDSFWNAEISDLSVSTPGPRRPPRSATFPIAPIDDAILRSHPPLLRANDNAQLLLGMFPREVRLASWDLFHRAGETRRPPLDSYPPDIAATSSLTVRSTAVISPSGDSHGGVLRRMTSEYIVDGRWGDDDVYDQ